MRKTVCDRCGGSIDEDEYVSPGYIRLGNNLDENRLAADLCESCSKAIRDKVAELIRPTKTKELLKSLR